MTVRAPASGDVDQHNFTAETRIVVGNHLAFEVGKIEVERLGVVLDAGVMRRVGRLGQALRASFGRPDGGHFFLTCSRPLSECRLSAAVTSSSAGRIPEKWLKTNLPSLYTPLSVPVSPSTRRIAAATSPPFCFTTNCHADSPFELFTPVSTQIPPMDGALPDAAGAVVRVGVKRIDHAVRTQIFSVERAIVHLGFELRRHVVPVQQQRSVRELAARRGESFFPIEQRAFALSPSA